MSTRTLSAAGFAAFVSLIAGCAATGEQEPLDKALGKADRQTMRETAITGTRIRRNRDVDDVARKNARPIGVINRGDIESTNAKTIGQAIKRSR